MILNLKKWTIKDYNSFIEYLYSLKDDKYREFTYRLIKNDNSNIIGVRTPALHKMAKEISKGNYLEFLKLNTTHTHEEKIIYGLVIGYLTIDFNEVLRLLNEFIPIIENWEICDLTCSNLKIFKQNKESGFKYITSLIRNPNSWIKRFGIVLLLDYYLCDEYIDKVLTLIKNVKDDNYYVEMAIAWLLSVAYIKYQNKVLDVLEKNVLSKNVVNLTIKKVCESYRVSNIDKEVIKKLKK